MDGTLTAEETVERVRRFSRLYTRRLGVLQDALLGSDVTLPEGRLVFEIAHREGPTATDLASALDLDPGYVSRLLKGLEQRGLVERSASEADARRALLRLSDMGRAAYETIDTRSNAAVGDLIRPLTDRDRGDLGRALATIERLLGEQTGALPTATLRDLRPGDLGWIIHRHGALYAEDYGWDGTFEAMVAKVAAEFVDHFDRAKDNAWIAEIDGRVVGSVFLVRKTAEIAKLRLLYVEPWARGQGLGRRLVETCIGEARRLGYTRLTLWTNDILVAARAIYESTGFKLVETSPHRSFGRDLVGETWELDL